MVSFKIIERDIIPICTGSETGLKLERKIDGIQQYFQHLGKEKVFASFGLTC